MIPWDTVCVDQVGPYTVTDHTGTDCTLMAMAFIDPATGWFEIANSQIRRSPLPISANYSTQPQ